MTEAANADQISLSYIAESTFGQEITGTPEFQKLRVTAESFGQDSSFVESNELVTDRQVADVIRTGVSASGGFDFELSYTEYDVLLQEMLRSAAWSSPVTTGSIATISFTSPDTISDSANGLGSMVVGQWVEVRSTGGAATTNDGFYKVATVAAGAITTEQQSITTDSAAASRTVLQGGQIVNGTEDQKSYNFEREYTDLTVAQFAVALGMSLDTFSLSITPEQIVTGNFGFIGSTTKTNTSTIGDGSPAASATNKVMDATSDVSAIFENNSSYGVTDFSINMTNNLRPRLEVATLGAVSIGAGKIGATGSINAFLSTAAVMDRYLANTETSLAIAFQDAAGNGYVIDFPAVKFTNGRRVAGGTNTDIIAATDWTAYKHATEGVTVRIARFAA